MKPTKTDQLNQALKAIRDAFEALHAAGVIGSPRFPELPPARRERFVRLLARMHVYGDAVKAIEGIAIGDENGPFLQADPELVKFYETEYRSYAKDLSIVPADLAYEYFDETFKHGIEGVDPTPEPSTKTALVGIVDLGLEMKYDALDDGRLNEDESHSVRQDVRSFERLEEFGLIDPDSWYQNLMQLKPVFSTRPTEKIPKRVRQRMWEVCRSFIYENWLSTLRDPLISFVKRRR